MLELKVGKTYIDKNQNEVTIDSVFVSNQGNSIYLGSDGIFYFYNGHSVNCNSSFLKENEQSKPDTRVYKINDIVCVTTKKENVITCEYVGTCNNDTEITSSLTNTGNGYIAKFTSDSCVSQDYYVCLDYSYAEELMIMLMHAFGDTVKEV